MQLIERMEIKETMVLCFYVESVADAVAKEHECEDEEHDGQAGQ